MKEKTTAQLFIWIAEEKRFIDRLNAKIEKKINEGNHRGADLLSFGIDESADLIRELIQEIRDRGYHYEEEDED